MNSSFIYYFIHFNLGSFKWSFITFLQHLTSDNINTKRQSLFRLLIIIKIVN